MTRSPHSRRALGLLVAWHLLLAIAAWLAPHPPSMQHRFYPDAPPTRIHWFSEQGLPAWPYVCALQPDLDHFGHYIDDCSQRGELHVLDARSDGRVALLGVDAPAKLFLLGTDEFGRDVFSRLLSGGLISIGSGLCAALVALLIASVLGGVAGFFGGFVDFLVSRTSEFLLALPVLYLLLAMRATLPIQTPPITAFFIAVLVVSLAGWARPARLVRGLVLSARECGFVLAAKGFGASNAYLLRKHILPQTQSVLLAQAALLVPQFVMLEVTLSFFGLGVPEPTASWGTMLSSLRQYPILASNWWMLSPAVALLTSLLLFGAYAQTLERVGTEPHN